MRRLVRTDHRRPLGWGIIFMTSWLFTPTADAVGPVESSLGARDKKSPVTEYEIKSGDHLGAIAKTYGVEMATLMKINEIDRADRIFAGQKIDIPADPKNGIMTPKGVLLHVPRGFTLTRIATAYQLPVSEIIKANKLQHPDRLQEDQQLLIPGAKKIILLVPPPPCFKDPVELFRVRNDQSQSLPLCFCNGRPNPAAVAALSAIAGPIKQAAPFPLHPRLVQLLQRIADRFPGKRIEIISGQRLTKQPGQESYHNKGQAIDFRVSGVSNRHLANFVRTFEDVGLGYYPNSVFIHMDTREQKAYWVDYSGPGERSIYAREGLSKRQIRAIRTRRNLPLRQRIMRNAEDNIATLVKSASGKPKQR